MPRMAKHFKPNRCEKQQNSEYFSIIELGKYLVEYPEKSRNTEKMIIMLSICKSFLTH